MTRRRLVTLVAACAVAVLALAGGAYAWKQHRQAERLASACADIRTEGPAQQEARAELEGEGEPTITVIGDSYSQALYIDPQQLGETFPYLVGEALGVPVHVDAVSGSGYINPGPCEGDPQDFLRRAGRASGQVVIVQGGLNDGTDAEALTGRARATYRAIRAADPDVLIYAVGPASVPGSDPDDLRVIDRALARAADGDVTFVSLLDLDLDVIEDGVHPTIAGHRQIADAITGRIQLPPQ